MARETDEMQEDTQDKHGSDEIAGFWRRLFAFAIDTCLIGIIGFLLGLFLFDYFVQLGGWARLVGFGTALLYFGLMNSVVFQGQTIGKRLTKIKVVSKNGESLGVGKSFLRFGIVGIPFFLNGAPIKQDVLMSWGGIVISIALFGLGSSIVYLVIFNRKTRQSLHDLIIDSYVVSTNATMIGEREDLWKGHYAVVSLLFIAAALLPVVTANLAETAPFSELLSLQRAIQNEPEVQYASVNIGKSTLTTLNTGTTVTNSISSRIVLAKKLDNYEELADRSAQIILRDYPRAIEKDLITVTISYGYDIGISSAWKSQNFSLSPEQWRGRF